MPDNKKDPKQNAADAGKGKKPVSPKQDEAGTKQKSGHEGHDMKGKAKG